MGIIHWIIKLIQKIITGLLSQIIIITLPIVISSFMLMNYFTYEGFLTAVTGTLDNLIPQLTKNIDLSSIYSEQNTEALEQIYSYCEANNFQPLPDEVTNSITGLGGVDITQIPCFSCEYYAEHNFSSAQECIDNALSLKNVNTTTQFLNYYAEACKTGLLTMTNEIDIPCLSCDSLLVYDPPSECLNDTLQSMYYGTSNQQLIDLSLLHNLPSILKNTVIIGVIILLLTIGFLLVSSMNVKFVINRLSWSFMISGALGSASLIILKGLLPTLMQKLVQRVAGGQQPFDVLSVAKPLIDYFINTPLSVVINAHLILLILGVALFLLNRFFLNKILTPKKELK